jgi:hypothetical protein
MDEPTRAGPPLRAARRTLNWALLCLLATLTVVLAGLGLANLLANAAGEARWNVLAQVGESFGAVNSVFSGLALAAVVVTFWLQFTELKSQRGELTLQRESLIRTHNELYRAAEANLRRLHVDLIEMAIKDPALASVWPVGQAGLSEERTKQYLYINLIMQNLRLYVRIGTNAELNSQIRHIFASPLVREYWKATASVRAGLSGEGSDEFLFTEVANRVCDEYESVLSQANGYRPATEPPVFHQSQPPPDPISVPKAA